MRGYRGNDMIAGLEVRSMSRDWAILSKRIGEDEIEDVGSG